MTIIPAIRVNATSETLASDIWYLFQSSVQCTGSCTILIRTGLHRFPVDGISVWILKTGRLRGRQIQQKEAESSSECRLTV